MFNMIPPVIGVIVIVIIALVVITVIRKIAGAAKDITGVISDVADIAKAVKRIFDSKTFDNGTICASEQSIVTESCIRDRVMEEVRRQGGYFLDPEESRKVSAFLLRSNGTMNPKIVGKTAEKIASMAGIRIPEGSLW